MSQIKKLLQAHIDYELDSWKGENLQKNLTIEIESLFDTMSAVNVENFIDKKSILNLAKKYLNERQIETESEELLLALSETAHGTISKNQDPLTSVITKSIFEESLKMAMDLKELRKDLIHTLTHSPVYTTMISSVMFNAIADFVGGENSFAKNVPGAFSLLKIGQDFIGNIPGIQAGIEKNLTAFIQSNLQNSLKQSEKLLNQELDTQTSKDLTDELWNFIGEKKISDLQHYADKEDLKKIIHLTVMELNYVKTSSLLLQILESQIEVIVSRYKGKKLGDLLTIFKIKKSDIIENLQSVFMHIISFPEIQNHIEKRITKRLEGFYNSENAKLILPD